MWHFNLLSTVLVATIIASPLLHAHGTATLEPDESRQQVTELSYEKPQQIHLSYTGQPDSMFVTWTTFRDHAEDNKVTFYAEGQQSSSMTLKASRTPVVHTSIISFGHINRTTYTYRATMTNLTPATRYYYYVRSGPFDSATFSFRTFPTYSSNNTEWNPRVAIYGDMGAVNYVSLPKIQQDVDKDMYDMILHIGDFAYNMNGFFGAKGDIFMNIIQPVASRVPYNFAVGNHEHHNNFSEYRGRFTGPEPSVFYHSFDVGPIHFVMFSAEFYFFTIFGTEQLQAQYNWIVEDLAKANTAEARRERPWIVVVAHRPMYCSALNPKTACRRENNPLRVGWKSENGTLLYGLEQLFLDNGVDLQFYAHEHNYERMLPIYDYTYEHVANTSDYSDPMFPVHVITGSAGCREFRGIFEHKVPQYTVFRTNQYGFTRLNVQDRLTLNVEQYSIDAGMVVDNFTVRKSSDFPNFGRTERQY